MLEKININKGEITVITGKAKVGKTTLLMQLNTELFNKKNNVAAPMLFRRVNEYKPYEFIDDYYLFKKRCEFVFMDLLIANKAKQYYDVKSQSWKEVFNSLQQTITKENAGLIMCLPLPQHIEDLPNISIDTAINELHSFFNFADKIVLLNRPEHYKENEIFGTTNLCILDNLSAEFKTVRLKAEFNNRIFKQY